MVWIQNLDEAFEAVGSGEGPDRKFAQYHFSQQSLLVFKMDLNHFPTAFDQSKDSCLALKRHEYWVCVGRYSNTSHTASFKQDARVSYPVYQSGVYALILNPKAPVSSQFSQLEFLFWNNQVVCFTIFGTAGLFVLILLVCLMCMQCERKRQAAVIQNAKQSQQGSILPDFIVDPNSEIDKDRFIEKLIQQLQIVEKSRNEHKAERK